MRTLRRLAWVALLTVAPVAGSVGVADSAVVVGGPHASPVVPAVSGATVIRLSRLHHVAAREVQLGRLGQVAGHRAETRAYGARLVRDFQAMQERIDAAAARLGVDTGALETTYAGENTAALGRESEDLTRLGNARGDEFDRQFWVVVAQDQLAASDLLLPVAGADPRLEPLVADLGQQLDLSSREALAAAQPVGTTPREGVPPASVVAPSISPAPVATPGPLSGRP